MGSAMFIDSQATTNNTVFLKTPSFYVHADVLTIGGWGGMGGVSGSRHYHLVCAKHLLLPLVLQSDKLRVEQPTDAVLHATRVVLNEAKSVHLCT